MNRVAEDRSVDSTVALLSEGYAFISNRCRRMGTDAFETRLLGRKTVCTFGEAAARMFYDSTRMQRSGAVPGPVQRTLIGRGGVQGLDGEAHRHRKQLFMSLMTPERIAALADATAHEWQREAAGWSRGDPVVLFDEAQRVLCRAVCAWAGVPLPARDVARRTADFDAMVGGGATPGWRHWQARSARRRGERWLAGLVKQARNGELGVGEQAPLSVVAAHTDPDGRPLSAQIAAVELLNVLRPTVAVATYVTFAALALHEYPAAREAVHAGNAELDSFVHEVRRYYPFFPFAAARVREPFEWREFRFEKGITVLLDLYGTNHDARIWERPAEFRPERFTNRQPDPFRFVPQGGGEHHVDHRCAGEWITIELIKTSVRFLTERIDYRVPRQDLGVSLRRIPTLPRSRFVIEPRLR